jgi:hypothetical protein
MESTRKSFCLVTGHKVPDVTTSESPSSRSFFAARDREGITYISFGEEHTGMSFNPRTKEVVTIRKALFDGSRLEDVWTATTPENGFTHNNTGADAGKLEAIESFAELVGWTYCGHSIQRHDQLPQTRESLPAGVRTWMPT